MRRSPRRKRSAPDYCATRPLMALARTEQVMRPAASVSVFARAMEEFHLGYEATTYGNQVDIDHPFGHGSLTNLGTDNEVFALLAQAWRSLKTRLWVDRLPFLLAKTRKRYVRTLRHPRVRAEVMERFAHADSIPLDGSLDLAIPSLHLRDVGDHTSIHAPSASADLNTASSEATVCKMPSGEIGKATCPIAAFAK